MEKKIVCTSIIGITIIIIGISAVVAIPTTFPQTNFESTTYSNEILIDKENKIKIGIIHSLSGTMAISEEPVAKSTLLAIEEINESGGILGKEVTPILKDGSSDWSIFAQSAEELIVDENVDVVFGGWTSASRKTMLPIFEKYDHLLFYPVQYEGLEQSKNIIYTGAAPNQQVIPALDWAYKNLGDTFFLVGSDYVFPHSANEIIKLHLNEKGGKIVGEEYHLLGDTNFEDTVQKIISSNPDVILNTINGDSNLAFFNQLREKGIFPNNIPTISFSIAENEIRNLPIETMQGDFASWNYFQSLDTPQNQVFVQNYKERFGQDKTVTDPMEAGYIGIYLYAKAVEQAGTTDIQKIREQLQGMTIIGPGGIVGIDPQNQHLAKSVRIGKILSNGQFEIVSSSENPIKPEPYPKQSPEKWKKFLDNLYHQWNENWENPERSS